MGKVLAVGWRLSLKKINKTRIFYNLHPEVTGGVTHLKVVCIVFPVKPLNVSVLVCVCVCVRIAEF